jgi:hypothetical protein
MGWEPNKEKRWKDIRIWEFVTRFTVELSTDVNSGERIAPSTCAGKLNAAV